MIEEEIDQMYQANYLGVFFQSDIEVINNLKAMKYEILSIEEEYWRLKSREF